MSEQIVSEYRSLWHTGFIGVVDVRVESIESWPWCSTPLAVLCLCLLLDVSCSVYTSVSWCSGFGQGSCYGTQGTWRGRPRSEPWSYTWLLWFCIQALFSGAPFSPPVHKRCCCHSSFSSTTSTGHFVGHCFMYLVHVQYIYLCVYWNLLWTAFFSFPFPFSKHRQLGLWWWWWELVWLLFADISYSVFKDPYS